MDQRKALARVVHTGAQKALARRRAQTWLRVDQGPLGPGDSDRAAAERLELSPQSVYRARQAWVHKGLEEGLQTAPMDHPRRARRLDGMGEAALVTLACARPPEG